MKGKRKRVSRIRRRDFIFESDLFSLASRRSVQARERALEFLGGLAAETRERADERLQLAIYQFVIEAVEEAGPPPSEVRDRLRKIAKQARVLDELITGKRGDSPIAEPLPAIRHALTAPSNRETGETNLAGVSVDGVIYVDNAPVTAAIEGVRAIERWVSVTLPRIERKVSKTRGGSQFGAAKRAFLSTLGDIYFEATDSFPPLWADRETGKARGAFADFVEAALEALIRSVKPAFDEAAREIHESICALADNRIALYQALRRDVAIVRAASQLRTGGREN